MDQGEWIELGVTNGWCAEPECQTHGLVAMTAEESAEFEEGGDPCVPVLRLWHEGEAPGRGGPHIVAQEPHRDNDAFEPVGEAQRPGTKMTL